MEKEKIRLYLDFWFCLFAGIVGVGLFLFSSIMSGWDYSGFGGLSFFILFLAIIFLIYATTYFFDIKGEYRWTKIVRIIFLVILILFIIIPWIMRFFMDYV